MGLSPVIEVEKWRDTVNQGQSGLCHLAADGDAIALVGGWY
jgi:hypothetical protein